MNSDVYDLHSDMTNIYPSCELHTGGSDDDIAKGKLSRARNKEYDVGFREQEEFVLL